MDVSNELDRQAFEAWLLDRWDRQVGSTYDSCSCPLACWLSEVRGVPHSVGCCSYGPFGSGGEEEQFLPEWARQFVLWADRLPDYEITGEQAKRVLDMVCGKEDVYGE